METKLATLEDIEDISRIHALSWKTAYKGIVPQNYLDELKEDFWIPFFVSIYLLPEYFGKGYGKVLLDAALTDIFSFNHNKLLNNK